MDDIGNSATQCEFRTTRYHRRHMPRHEAVDLALDYGKSLASVDAKQ